MASPLRPPAPIPLSIPPNTSLCTFETPSTPIDKESKLESALGFLYASLPIAAACSALKAAAFSLAACALSIALIGAISSVSSPAIALRSPSSSCLTFLMTNCPSFSSSSSKEHAELSATGADTVILLGKDGNKFENKPLAEVISCILILSVSCLSVYASSVCDLSVSVVSKTSNGIYLPTSAKISCSTPLGICLKAILFFSSCSAMFSFLFLFNNCLSVCILTLIFLLNKSANFIFKLLDNIQLKRTLLSSMSLAQSSLLLDIVVGKSVSFSSLRSNSKAVLENISAIEDDTPPFCFTFKIVGIPLLTSSKFFKDVPIDVTARKSLKASLPATFLSL
mmetsp:Transcript_8851/g.8758  ORF Transcript_8851/g.8758 Transcript_8851/m.8758 type:complete len:338 (+) Transcript_8851:655-1668(+)